MTGRLRQNLSNGEDTLPRVLLVVSMSEMPIKPQTSIHKVGFVLAVVPYKLLKQHKDVIGNNYLRAHLYARRCDGGPGMSSGRQPACTSLHPIVR